jgi:hypothetical protein
VGTIQRQCAEPVGLPVRFLFAFGVEHENLFHSLGELLGQGVQCRLFYHDYGILFHYRKLKIKQIDFFSGRLNDPGIGGSKWIQGLNCCIGKVLEKHVLNQSDARSNLGAGHHQIQSAYRFVAGLPLGYAYNPKFIQQILPLRFIQTNPLIVLYPDLTTIGPPIDSTYFD